MNRLIIGLSMLLIIAACSNPTTVSETIDITPAPTADLSYTYHVKGASIRQMGDRPEEMSQDFTFHITFQAPSSGIFPADIRFGNIAMETPEDDLYEDIFQGALRSLQEDSHAFQLMPSGVFYYEPVLKPNLEESLNFEDPEVYIEAMTDYMKESFKANLFTEWITYVPDGPINLKSTWTTRSDLSLMGITEVDRIFKWSVEEITDSTIQIKGQSVVKSFDFEMNMGPGMSMELTYEGTITSTYRYELDRTHFLIKNAHIQLITDGKIKSKGDIPNTEKLDEPLTGEANTFITRSTLKER